MGIPKIIDLFLYIAQVLACAAHLFLCLLGSIGIILIGALLRQCAQFILIFLAQPGRLLLDL